MNPDELKHRLSALDTACLCDAEKALQTQLRVMDRAIRPINTGVKLLGRARTVSCHEDFLTVIKGLKEAEAGEVLVIDTRGSRKALTGGLFPTEAWRKGLAGIVIDGYCRDTQAIRQIGIPYYARGVHCFAGTTNRLFATQVPVTCGGVVVNPTDLVFGDDDGLLVASGEQFAQLLPVAEQIKAAEQRLVEKMAEGVSLLDMVNFDEHCAKLKAGEPSLLRFLVDGGQS